MNQRPLESIGGVPNLDDHYRKQRIPYGLHGIRCLGHLRPYWIGHGLSRLFPEGRWRVVESPPCLPGWRGDLNSNPLDAARGVATATDETRKLPNTSVW